MATSVRQVSPELYCQAVTGTSLGMGVSNPCDGRGSVTRDA
jgi:hypothetical protein